MKFWHCLLLLTVLAPLAATAQWRDDNERFPPPGYRGEHPQARLAYWYADESLRQVRQARDMVCGFAGQHWTLDWEVHYRWALRTNPRRIYARVEQRDQHLTRCRRSKLRGYRDTPDRPRR
ncbi:MAG: hypothetical protein HND55_01230 [Pseudomonadota bacterium]|nr:MAG: hypothetical protein HND55_01230 [Pseudomonadota bacterium]